MLAVVRSHFSNDVRMTIFSSTEPKFVIFFFTEITWKYTLLNLSNAVLHFARFFSHGLFVFELFRPRVISICPSFWPDRGRGKQQLTSFRAHFFLFISRTKRRSVQSDIQCRTRFFSNLVKVIGFRDFFWWWGGGGVGGSRGLMTS